MNINVMRQLDYWLGNPLCFFISILNRITRYGKAVANKQAYQKILFIKLSEMGAIILAYPLLQRIKEEYPAAELFFVTVEKNKPVLGLFGGIIKEKNIFTISENSLFLFITDTFKVIRKIRRERMDIALDLEFFSRFSAILTYLSHADKKIGFYRYTFEGLYRGCFFTHNIQYNPLNHISRTYLSLFQTIKTKEKFTPELEEKIKDTDIILPKIVLVKNSDDGIEARLEKSGVNRKAKLILINPGEGNLPLREWSLENFISLSKRLLEDVNKYIIVIGANDDSKKAKLFCDALNTKNCLNLVSRTTLPELITLFDISDLLISNDCGLAHLASLTAIKKFILFGPESPQIFSPLGKGNYVIYSNLPCSPCLSVFNHRNSSCRDNKCLKIITPDDVYELIYKNEDKK